jgi:Tfp pilus assembly protein PilX
MSSTTISALRKRLLEEEGIALVMALGITVVLIIFVASMISYTSESSRNSNLSRSRVTAQSIAEGGISAAASIINKASNASDPTILGCSAAAGGVDSALPCTGIPVSLPGGTATVRGMYTQNSNTGTWAITANGSVVNPTGTGNLTKTMTANMTITGGGQSNNISVWNYVYSTAPQGSGCEVNITGTNAVLDTPLYVTGDLCLSGTNAQIIEDKSNGGQAVDVRVKGTVSILGSNSTIGTAAAKLTSGLAEGGCITIANPTAHSCTTADKWFVNSTDSPITATVPTVDFASWYTNASPGPSHGCTSALSGLPQLANTKLDSDSTMNGTTPSWDLTGSSYSCVTSSGALSWNSSTHLLSISGTIFIDGNVSMSDTSAMYHGLGTVYINGALSMTGTKPSLRAGCPASPATPTKQCNFSDVAKEWDPNKDNILFIVNKKNATAVDFSPTQAEFQGGILCDSTSTIDLSGTQTKVEGPIICGKFDWFTLTKILPLPTITNLPPGAPVPPNAPATISPPVITSG